MEVVCQASQGSSPRLAAIGRVGQTINGGRVYAGVFRERYEGEAPLSGKEGEVICKESLFIRHDGSPIRP